MSNDFLKQTISRRELMKTALKTSLTLGALASLGPILSACSTDQEASIPKTSNGKSGNPVKTGSIAYQTYNVENDYFSLFDKGVLEAATALGLTHQFFAHNGDPNLELNQVDQFSVQSGKMMMTYTSSDGVVPQWTKACQDAKIFCNSTHNSPAWFTPLHVGDYYVQFNGANNSQLSYELAVLVFDKIGKKGTVVHIPGLPGSSADIHRTIGIKRALKDYPDIKLVTAQPGNWNRTDARRALEDVLSKVSNIDGVIAQNDDEAMGAIEVLKERKIKAPVVGIDGNPEALDAIISGDMLATHSELANYQGGYNTVVLFDALNGWKPSLPERMVFLQSVLTTKDNVAAIKQKVYGSDKSGFDWVKMSRTLNPDSWDPQFGVEPIDVWKFWDGLPVEAGNGLPAAYEEARKKGEFEKAAAVYKERYKMKFM